MKERIILALDFDNSSEAIKWVKRLRGDVGLFKIGKQLFTAEGPDVVKKIVKEGGRVFLDLKFHDIPNTVAGASIEAVRLGARMLNVHALGGYEMMARSSDAVLSEAGRLGVEKPMLIAVTILTSMNENALTETGISVPLKDEVIRLALLARKAGLDGVVASPREIKIIKEACGDEFIVVTPGVRPVFASRDDQERIMTPKEAMEAGADYLVIGRPVTKAADPRSVARMIAEEMCQD